MDQQKAIPVITEMNYFYLCGVCYAMGISLDCHGLPSRINANEIYKTGISLSIIQLCIPILNT